MPSKQGELTGLVTHYFSKIGVGVVELSNPLKVGDSIKVFGKDVDFDQTVDSIEVDGQKVQAAKSGIAIGLKLNQRAKEGCRVFKF
jgi:selenocysteine-specific translation elongation factor